MTDEASPHGRRLAHPHADQEAAAASAYVAVLSFSDTRTPETDVSGKAIVDLVTAAGHVVTSYEIVREDVRLIDRALRDALSGSLVSFVITTGGTGVAPRDSTYEVASRIIERPMDGFGELFRMLSFEQVGSAAMLSRAVAGLVGTKFLFVLPGSSNAVRLALSRLILPQMAHMLAQVASQPSPASTSSHT